MNDNPRQERFKELLEKAEFYILNQKYSEAAKILKQAIATDDEDPHAHYLYGLALEGSNEQEKAKQHFRRVLELDPEHAEAKTHLDRLIGH
jgi:Tfp pilus assembly protein PilF